MKCWICNINDANSGDHFAKATDIRLRFGAISKAKPLYKHTHKYINKKIYSSNSDKLKFSKTICEYCNNTRTQPYDMAWEKLSGFLHENWADIKKKGRFDLSKVFSRKTNQGLLFVHLYFVKQLGCRIVEGKIQKDISTFSSSLMNQMSHPDIRMIFSDTPRPPSFSEKYIHSSDVKGTCDLKSGVIVSVRWIYTLYPLSVRVAYVDKRYAKQLKPYMFVHPDKARKVISLGGYRNI